MITALKAIALIFLGSAFTGVVFYSFVYLLFTIAPQENTARVLRTVEAVCDYSHGIYSGEAEEACTRAQDVSGTIYTCKGDICQVE